MDKTQVARIVEMGLFCASRPCPENQLLKLFTKEDKVTKDLLREGLEELTATWSDRALALHRSAGGWQIRSREDHKERLRQFLEATPPRLSRPMTEVLAIVAYHQPVTRGDIESLRGVSTSANQLAHLEELGWVEVVGKKEVPGRPLEYGTTTRFLDDLGIKDLSELPDLEEFAQGIESPNGQDGHGDLKETLRTKESKVDSGNTGEKDQG